MNIDDLLDAGVTSGVGTRVTPCIRVSSGVGAVEPDHGVILQQGVVEGEEWRGQHGALLAVANIHIWHGGSTWKKNFLPLKIGELSVELMNRRQLSICNYHLLHLLLKFI